MLEALKLVTDSFTNLEYRASFVEVSHQIERGIPMSVPINENKLFPIMVGQMVSVGEQTGKMDEVMTRLADYYENEVDAKMGGISTLIEPIVIVLLGIGVAWLVVGILLPIYQISSTGG
jgi:type IV pilus assembly protein PilC